MFKRVLLFAALTMVAVGMSPAIPAQAASIGTVCRDHEGPDGTGGLFVRVCVKLNSDGRIRGYSDWDQPSDFTIVFGDPHIRFHRDGAADDGVELRRGSCFCEPADDIIRQNGSNGFVRMETSTNVHTDWYDPFAPSQCFGTWYYRSTARYQIRWDAVPGQPLSSWYVLGSIKHLYNPSC